MCVCGGRGQDGGWRLSISQRNKTLSVTLGSDLTGTLETGVTTTPTCSPPRGSTAGLKERNSLCRGCSCFCFILYACFTFSFRETIPQLCVGVFQRAAFTKNTHIKYKSCFCLMLNQNQQCHQQQGRSLTE